MNAYRSLFAAPGAAAFTAGNLIARLPMGMFGVSAVTMIVAVYGSYALAGAVTATGLAATAVAGPWTARLADRFGQARVTVPTAAIAAAGSLALALCVRLHQPPWTLFAAYAVTATTPNTGGMSRARWAHLHRDDPAARHTANSFEQAADEVCFMLGPVVAVWLCTWLSPEAGTVTGAVLLLTGALLFAAQRRTQPPVDAAASAARVPLRPPRGMGPPLAAFLCTGVVFGALQVAAIAFTDRAGERGAAGVVLGLQAAGSGAAGMLYGLLRPRRSPRARFTAGLAGMAAVLPLPFAAALLGGGHLPLMAAALLTAGVATAPAMVGGMSLVQARMPPSRLHEGMSLAVTAILAGIAGGQALGGWTVDRLGPAAAFAIPVAGGLLALPAALLTPRDTPG